MSPTIGEPACRQLENGDEEIARRQDRRDGGDGDVLLLDPPQHIEAMHEALDRGDVVGGVEREVSSKRESVVRHVERASELRTEAIRLA